MISCPECRTVPGSGRGSPSSGSFQNACLCGSLYVLSSATFFAPRAEGVGMVVRPDGTLWSEPLAFRDSVLEEERESLVLSVLTALRVLES